MPVTEMIGVTLLVAFVWILGYLSGRQSVRDISGENQLRQRIVILEKQIVMYRRQLGEIPQKGRDIEALRTARRLVRRHNSDVEKISPVVMALVKTQESVQQEI